MTCVYFNSVISHFQTKHFQIKLEGNGPVARACSNDSYCRSWIWEWSYHFWPTKKQMMHVEMHQPNLRSHNLYLWWDRHVEGEGGVLFWTQWPQLPMFPGLYVAGKAFCSKSFPPPPSPPTVPRWYVDSHVHARKNVCLYKKMFLAPFPQLERLWKRCENITFPQGEFQDFWPPRFPCTQFGQMYSKQLVRIWTTPPPPQWVRA